jgi:DNA-binding NarL/FixJ family response regulator
MNKTTTQVLIADDHEQIRKIVKAMLERDPHLVVCGEAADGAEAVQQALKLHPDVVLLNIRMPVLNGFEAAREIKSMNPAPAIVILSSNMDERFLDEAKKIGVQGYVAKTDADKHLVKAIQAAAAGDEFVFLEK